MAKVFGYEGRVEFSENSVDYFALSNIQDFTFDRAGNTEDETTWDDKGFVNEQVNSTTVTMEISGLYNDADIPMKFFKKSSNSKSPIYFRYFERKSIYKLGNFDW